MTENRGKVPGMWQNSDCGQWDSMLESYPQVIRAQGNDKLVDLDNWYRDELPALLATREKPYITLEELQKVAAWKMTRGVWRERNRHLIGGNAPEQVEELSRRAFTEVPDPRKPIKLLSDLAGVGPATASAVTAAYRPGLYPFFDELVAAQIPGLGPVAFTLKYYMEYSEALRERATQLSKSCGRTWTAQDVTQALWAASGGKVSAG